MDKLKNIKGIFNDSSLRTKIIAGVVILAIIIFIWREYKNHKINNPLYFTNGKDSKILEEMNDNIFIRNQDSVQFTYHMFLYLDSWDYNIYWFKPIIMKSTTSNQFCPLMYFEPVVNNLVAVITTENGRNYTMRIKDFPIKRWTHVALSVDDVSGELYINGLLAETINLDSPAKQNTGNLQICPMGGFSGFLSKLAYRPVALSSKEIFELSRRPIIDFKMLGVSIKNINVGSMAYKPPTESDLNVNPESLVVFGSIPNSLKPLKAVNNNIYSNMNNQMVNASVNANNKNKSNNNNCPSENDAPDCPLGTLACNSNQRYCYYPDRNVMVSTYMIPEYDYCPSKNIGKKDGNLPFKISGIDVWTRTGGKDTATCSNIK